ncbi:hypothetical protein AWB67_00877 [Caballeronia terrestris]|uniref:Extensin-like C-terminal domain-containing protein n=1 Tax=Caballeronia terrestris TaxID=1226301 RepID=A0A158FU80_9BURK|nr:extensin family protein [Caballeronia terrestris]SAL23388.1 hypothetical protein AWB67_00877 [Caballeronia terrestris]
MGARIAGWLLLIVFLIVIVGVALVGFAMYSGRVAVPDKWNPFAPLDVREPRGPLTSIKLWRIAHDHALCMAALDRSGVAYRPIADSSKPAGCELNDVLRVTQSDVQYSGPFLATCPLAVGMALFEHQTLQPAAEEIFGQPVRKIEHVGSFACRNVNNQEEGARSQHASANAIDLSGFVLESGRRVTFARWDGDSSDAVFLHRLHDGACRAFNTTLGPDYNALHRMHFHVDMGPYRLCR